MVESTVILSYAVRLRVVAKYLGLLAFMLAMLSIVPMLVSIGFEEYFVTQRYAVLIVVLLVVAWFTSRFDYPEDIQNNEALAITALAFVITPLLVSYPLMSSGLSFIDAWFEAVSAITTTGLSTVAQIEDMPHTFRFARAWMQWYGGLGIVVLSVALLLGNSIAIKRLIGGGGESMLTSNRHYARRVLVIYCVLSLLGVIVLWLMLGDLFQAITHALAAISTGGFSPLNMGVADAADWGARFAIVFLGLLGATPLVLYYRLFRGNWKQVISDTEFRALLIIIAVMCALVSMSMHFESHLSWRDALGHGFFLGISAQSTVGFSTFDLAQLGPASMGLLMLAMFIGGGVGSTAGGIKILRLIIFWRLVQLILRRSGLPSHAVAEARIDDKVIDEDEITRALLLIILFAFVIAISWGVFLAYGYPALPSLFEVTSAVGTVGLSSGVTSADLPAVLKLVLCIDMLLGRLEIIALLIILFPPTWIGKRTS